MHVKGCIEVGEGIFLLDILQNVANSTHSEVELIASCLRGMDFSYFFFLIKFPHSYVMN
jgi:hypothetical protein